MNTWWAWRLWDCFVGAAPLAASAFAGALLIAWVTRRRHPQSVPGTAAIIGLGCAVVQPVTWVVALFAPFPIAAFWHWTMLAAAAASIAFAAMPSRPAALAPLQRWPVRCGLVAAPLLAFVIAHPNDLGQTPSDAWAYHLPAAHWFASGGAWADLPRLLWTAQLPLASSLWTSFAMGVQVPVADPFVGWIAVNVAMVTWTSIVVADTLAPPATPWRLRVLATAVGGALVFGAYTAQSGFVDYTSGLLAVCLIAMLAPRSGTEGAPWMAALVAAALAECRPQGLILAAALVATATALAPAAAWRTALSARGLMALVAACVLGAKWYVLLWARWGTPFVPLLGGAFGAAPEVLNAEAVYRGAWPPAPLAVGLDFALGASGVAAVTAASWLLLGIGVVVAWRTRRVLRDAPWLGLTLPAALAPVLWVVFIASQNRTQAPRMAVVAVPVCLAVAAVLVRARAEADRFVNRAWTLALAALVLILLAGAPRAWNGEYIDAGSYPTGPGRYFVQTRRQLEAFRGSDPCVLNQYGAALPPRGLRFIGGLVPPWTTMPARLQTADDWITWLRRHGARTVLTREGWRLEPIWLAIGQPPANVAAFDAWLKTCPGRFAADDWIVCRLPD